MMSDASDMLVAALEQMDGIIAGNLHPLKDAVLIWHLLGSLGLFFIATLLLPLHFDIFIYWLSPVPLGSPWFQSLPFFPLLPELF